MISLARDKELPNSGNEDNKDIAPTEIVQETKPSRSVAEMSHVVNIRKFFDHKAECFTKDKLSQAYIITTFTKDELWEYVEKECKGANKDEYQLNVDDLRAMFQAYCQEPEFSPTLKFPKESWNIFDSKKRKDLCDWCLTTPKSIFLLFAWKNFLSFSFIGTAGVFVWNTPVREQQKYFQAWQVINTAQNQSGTGGRNEALKYLNGGETIPFLNWAAPQCKKNNTCLVGIKMTGGKEEANLNDVDLENANLEASAFGGVSFRGANLKNDNFKNADLKGAVFEEANLTGADFRFARNVNLADFSKAKFCNTKWPGKDGPKRPDCWTFFH